MPKIEIGSSHVKKTQTNGTLLFHCGLAHFPREDEFQPAGVVEPPSWHQGIHIAKVDLSSNRCFGADGAEDERVIMHCK